jgi:hypothetical protein
MDEEIVARLGSGERIIDELTVEMITEGFSKRMFKMSYGPSGTIALTTERVLFVGGSSTRVRRADVTWEMPLDHVRGAVYYPFTLSVFTRTNPMPGQRFPVVAFSRGEPATKWSSAVRELVGPYVHEDRTGAVDGEWQVRRLAQLRTQLRSGELTEQEYQAAKQRLLDAPE